MDITFCDGCGAFIECYDMDNGDVLCEECYKASLG
jgi:hypothetical protein